MSETSPRPFAAVALNVPLERTFHYRVPDALAEATRAGARVRVPFGRRTMIGVCVGFVEKPDVPEKRLRDIIALIDRTPLLDQRMLDLTRWMADYYSCSWGEALDAVLPGAVKKGRASRTILMVSPGRPPDALRERAEALNQRAARQARVLRALASARGEIAARDLLRLAEADYGVLQALARAGDLSLRKERVTDDPSLQFDVEHATPPEPTPDQAAALARIDAGLKADVFRVMLVHGVTGSGKTELYLQALDHVVKLGRQGIVLVPEIALTPQTVARFRARFDRVCVMHSELSERRRRDEWRRIREGKADVVVGARSAVFAPVPRLGLFVVDEEHETSFKQENTPRYHARDVGIWRAREEGALVLLGSATPSFESLHNARSGKYDLIELPRRVVGRPMPRVEILDLNTEPARRGHTTLLSRRLKLAADAALQAKEQVILFLNRRGFHTHIACANCGHVLCCDHCDVSMTYHKPSHTVRCHYCGDARPAPKSCPACNADKLRYAGSGTQRVEDEIARLFEGYNVARMDSDAMHNYGAYEKTLSEFRDGGAQILLGTQMVAKGLDFPNVTLVGVVNADISLNMPDFRASERTFQLLMQVSGRAGRGDRPGRVIIQTYNPEHPAVRCAAGHDFEGFLRYEMEDRRTFGYPPFGRLARVLVEGKNKQAVVTRIHETAKTIREALPEFGAELLGPVEAPIPRIKGRYRWHCIIKAQRASMIRRALRPVERKKRKGTQIAIDVDPVALL